MGWRLREGLWAGASCLLHCSCEASGPALEAIAHDVSASQQQTIPASPRSTKVHFPVYVMPTAAESAHSALDVSSALLLRRLLAVRGLVREAARAIRVILGFRM